MLSFNSDAYTFWEIYDAIKRFYPIGIKKDESNLFFSYPGLKELVNIIVDNIHDDEHFTERWDNFTKELEKETGKEIIGTTYGQAPSFSSYVLLETSYLDNLTRTKEIHFFVSLVGQFYTVIGQDINSVKLDENTYYRSTSYLVASPEREFESVFKLLCEKIERRFTGYKFVPLTICQQIIDGLQVRYSDRDINTVFHALFNDQIEINTWREIGNNFYKAEDWVKEGYKPTGGGWTMYPDINQL